METKKLRQKLLDLAIRGKLAPQDSNDEPASELLSRIHAEKLAMVERGELKPKDVKNDTVIYFGSDGLPYEKRADGKGEAKCVEGEVPFELPVGWQWVRFSSFSLSTNTGPFGVALHKTDYVENGIPVVNPADIRDGVIFPGKRVTPLTCKRLSSYVLKKGDFVIGRRGEMGRAAFVDQNQGGWLCGTGCFFSRMSCSVDASFLSYLFKADYVKRQLEKDAIGTTLKNLNLNVLGTLLIPVPPLAEQRRIVDALDKYLALVDAIERDRTDLEGLLARLKSKVLDLAVREEKLAMVELGELKPKDVKSDTVIFTGSDGLRYEKPADGKGEPRCIEDEIPFELPEGWAWARLGQIVATCGGKTPSKANKEFWEGDGVPWITSKDMKAAELYGSQIELAPLGAAETGTVPAGSVLMVVGSGILRRLLPVAINRVETTINQDLKAMTPFHGGFSKWLLTCFSAWDKRIRNTYHKDGTTVDSIEFDSMLTMLLPVPPLAEQRRIVERIEELFNHLD